METFLGSECTAMKPLFCKKIDIKHLKPSCQIFQFKDLKLGSIFFQGFGIFISKISTQGLESFISRFPPPRFDLAISFSNSRI